MRCKEGLSTQNKGIILEGMGVYHFAGLGRSPGAVSSPLSIIYILLKAAEEGHEKAKEFFQHSGEISQELKGAPEYLMILTSSSIIKGEEQAQEARSKLFQNKKFVSSPLRILVRYLKTLTETLGLDAIYREGWIKRIYAVEVKYLDFQDCYEKANTILNACRDKECWVNTQAGSNQITSSVTISASINLIAGKYYYVKQTNITELDPPDLTPAALNNPADYVDQILVSWGELPIFGLGINKVIEEIDTLFMGREKVTISEVYKKLEKYGLSGITLSKLRPYLIIEGDTVRRSPRFNELKYLISTKIPNITNVSEMERIMKERGILYDIDPETGEVSDKE